MGLVEQLKTQQDYKLVASDLNFDDLLIRPLPCVTIHTMNASQSKASISDVLRQTIVESGVSYNALQKETGVTRASIMRFVRGDQSIRLDMADRLAEYFHLELVLDRLSQRTADNDD